MALWSIAFLGSRPVAAALSGALSDAFSEGVALLTATAIILIGAAVSRPSLTRAETRARINGDRHGDEHGQPEA